MKKIPYTEDIIVHRFINLDTGESILVGFEKMDYESLRNYLRNIDYKIGDYTWDLTWQITREITEEEKTQIYGIN